MRTTVIGFLRDPAFRRHLQIVVRYKWLYAAAIGSQVALTAVALLTAETSRRLFDVAPNISQSFLVQILTAYVAFTVVRMAVSYLGAWAGSLLNETIVYEMRRDVLNHLQNLPLEYFELRHSSDSNNILYHELEQAKDLIVNDVQSLIALPLSLIFIGGYLLTVHPWLAALAVAIGPLQSLSSQILKSQFKAAMREQRKVTRDVFHTIGETLQGIREVKANQLEGHIDERMMEIQQRGVANNVTLTKVRSLRNLGLESPREIGYIAGIAVGAWLMQRGEIGAGGLIAFITLLDRVAAPFSTLVRVVSNVQQALEGTRKLYETLDMTREDRDTGIELDHSAPSIAFETVSFEYLPETPILSDVSFAIPGGSTLALVGPSGSGKSTLVKLLFRFYEPDAGMIRVEGRPIHDYSVQTIRQRLALLSQEVFLFDATVEENIGVGRMGATGGEIAEAAQLAQADDFIRSLPNGYASEIGERGIKLSHGQKQRLAIARAILSDASVLILDEPTSALDVETEENFQHALRSYPGKRTKIVIAHRLSTIRDADFVLFLEEGRVIEFGPPSVLLAQRGRFADYWQRQSLNEVDLR
ncbi:MAG: ABC transporter ATP-binding protein [Fimbriimonas sp.]